MSEIKYRTRDIVVEAAQWHKNGDHLKASDARRRLDT
ncbi:hypothetical protein LCGC14_1398390 [marine sediment metagenome]|uniref:Uncharacterized protein n=1 Tax=marine sediment metagenome TaxID=412755 RepID=A0A0F9JXV1_9ZZZZ